MDIAIELLPLLVNSSASRFLALCRAIRKTNYYAYKVIR